MFTASTEQHAKLDALKEHLKALGCVCVAYSGGVDSTFLVKVAHDVLGEKAFALTNHCSLYPLREHAESVDFARNEGFEQTVVSLDPLQLPEFQDNPPDRCYHCKKALFSRLQAMADDIARNKGVIATGEHATLIDGSNLSDLDDYRPGHKAVVELGVVSPLQQAQLTKQDIRDLSHELGLPTWNKPSYACLASRFPYGTHITAELLERADKAEQLMMDAGFRTVRARVHENGTLARIEVGPDRVTEALAFLQARGAAALHAIGFKHVSLDTDGYRTGSMN